MEDNALQGNITQKFTTTTPRALMTWYNVVKTINGNKYIYQQRTYRYGGKMRTENKYVGPVGGGRRAGAVVNLTSFDESEAQNIVIKDKCDLPPPRSSTPQIHQYIRNRSDVSERALIKDEQYAYEKMVERGLTTTNLKPIHVQQGRAISREEKENGYYVYAGYGQRTLFKREYRKALAERWIDAIRNQDPDCYSSLCMWVNFETSFAALASTKSWFAFFVDWWHGRKRGHDQAVEMLGEMIQHGQEKTYEKYAKAARKAEMAAIREWKKFNRLVRPKARKRQYKKCLKVEAKSKLLGAKHGQALWVRMHVFHERPVVARRSRKKWIAETPEEARKRFTHKQYVKPSRRLW